jgi:hypothetical protein
MLDDTIPFHNPQSTPPKTEHMVRRAVVIALLFVINEHCGKCMKKWAKPVAEGNFGVF